VHLQLAICNLCRQSSELRDSHIFPEFFYRGTYDEKHRAKLLTTSRRAEPDTVQKGLRERLLCGDCERRLSRHETYAAEPLRRADDLLEGERQGVTLPEPNLDSFRLFALSVLWRAHEAQSEMFADVDLGPHGEQIRDRVLREQPGDPTEYGFAIAKVGGLGMHGDLIEAPQRTKYKGFHVYQFLARGYIWCFATTKGAKSLTSSMPFVGTIRDLPIPIVNLNRGELFANIRRAFPNLFRK
jgi:hypothetical protein